MLNSTTALLNTNFETIYTTAGLTGTIDVSKLGTGVDTIGLLGDAAGALVVNTVPTAFTFGPRWACECLRRHGQRAGSFC